MVQTLHFGANYVLERCVNAECEAMAALAEDSISRLRDTHKLFYCSRGHGMSYTGKTRAQLETEAAASESQKNRADAEALMRLEAEQRLARVEEEKARVERELREARRTTRKAVTVGAHAVKATKSAHAHSHKKAKA